MRKSTNKSPSKSKLAASQVSGLERKSAAGSTSTTRKKKKAGMDEETKAKLASMEGTIEDLRKQAFGEINRLEAFLEKQKED